MNRLAVAPLFNFYSNFRDPLPNKIRLVGGYEIKKFDQKLLEPFFNFYHEAFSSYDKEDLGRCMYAIYKRHNTSEDDNTFPEDIKQDIYRITHTLRIVKRTRVVPAIMYLRWFGSRKKLEPRDALSFNHKPTYEIYFIDTDPDMEHFTKKDAYKIRKYWEEVRGLYTTHANGYHKVLNSVIFFELGHQTYQYKVRLTNFITALESLFNTGSEQIGYGLKIRCSYFLERNPAERNTLASEIKEIYRLRSLFVHGQGAPPRILTNLNRQKELLMKTEDIARSCLQKIFDNKSINIFGNEARLNQELNKLELGDRSALL